jgi:O-antigen ligase
MARLAPLGLLVIAMSQLVSPGALSGVRYEFTGGNNLSSQGRTSDYKAVAPDLKTHYAFGRGFGSYDPKIQNFKKMEKRRHRILDNQYLMLLIETGVIGIAAWLIMLITAWATSHRLARSSSLTRAGPALASIAGIASFLVGTSLFDVLAFAQVPYMLFLLFGLTVANSAPDDDLEAVA